MKFLFKRRLLIILILMAIYLLTSSVNNNPISARDIISKEQFKSVNKDINKNAQVLSIIDKYQAEYFEIIKRNNYFLQIENNSKLKKDKKELKKIFKEVEKQIVNKKYLKEYKAIEKRYKKCDKLTTPEINDFAENNYNEVDNLLNKVYQEVKSTISPEDFKNLASKEKEWLQEVDNYEKVFNSMNFGTIGTSIYYTYQIDMRNFRTLLLMLYL